MKNGIAGPEFPAADTFCLAAAGRNRPWFPPLSRAFCALKRDDFSSNRHLALGLWWSMIFSENRYTLFGIML
jgi:hypothetical protein